MRYLIVTLLMSLTWSSNAQEVTLHEFFSKQYDYYNYPLEVLSQTDTSVTVLSEVEMNFGKDLLITKYTTRDTQSVYERRLHLDSLFNGWFNSKEINFYFLRVMES